MTPSPLAALVALATTTAALCADAGVNVPELTGALDAVRARGSDLQAAELEVAAAETAARGAREMWADSQTSEAWAAVERADARVRQSTIRVESLRAAHAKSSSLLPLALERAMGRELDALVAGHVDALAPMLGEYIAGVRALQAIAARVADLQERTERAAVTLHRRAIGAGCKSLAESVSRDALTRAPATAVAGYAVTLALNPTRHGGFNPMPAEALAADQPNATAEVLAARRAAAPPPELHAAALAA